VRFCSRAAHAVASFFFSLQNCDIAGYMGKTNGKSTFSRFHSFRAFLRKMCFSVFWAAHGLQKLVFFGPPQPEPSELEFLSIFDLFWLHFWFQNAKKWVPGGGPKKRGFLGTPF